jgi:hypothetical protein
MKHDLGSIRINGVKAASVLLVFAFCLAAELSSYAQQVWVMQANIERGLGRQSNNTNAQAKALARISIITSPISSCSMRLTVATT